MSQTKIVREETVEENRALSAVLLDMKNSCIVFLSEGEESLGTLAVALPQQPGMIGPALSSTLLGERNTNLARLLAERLAGSMKKMVLVSVFVRSMNEREAGRAFLALLEKTLQKMGA